MKQIVFFLIFLFYYLPLLAQKQVDSLTNIIRTHNQTDTSHILAVIELANLYRYNKADTSLLLASEALENAKKINYAKGAGRASRVIGIYYREKGNLKSAIEFLELSINFCKQINDADGLGFAYNSIAAIHRKEANYSLAMEYCLKALLVFELSNNKTGEAYVLNHIGTIYGEQGHYEQGIKYLEKSLAIDQKKNRKIGLFYSYFGIAEIHRLQNNYKKALEYQLKNLKLAEDLKNKPDIIYACNHISLCYIAIEEPLLALPYLQKGLGIATEIKNIERLADINITLAKYYNVTNQDKEALKYAKIALELAKKIKDIKKISEAAFEYSEAMAKNENYKEALIAYQLYKKMEDTLSSQESNKKVMAKEYAYKDEKKKIEQEQKDIEHQKELEKQNFYRYLLLIGLGIVLIIIFLVVRNNHQRHKAYNLLRQKNEEINQKNEEINQKNNEIQATLALVEKQKQEIQYKNENTTASIMYAKRIQKAMLPFEERISDGLKKENYFILYKPRDIVSGDFYFYEEIKNKIIIAVGDCTGHGVPGAFMSMIGNQILTEIIVKNRLLSPEKILNILHHDVRRTLKQSVNLDSGDGMDIAIVVLTKNEKIPNMIENTEIIYDFALLEYAGAMNPLFVVQNNEIIELKADKKSIGGQAYKDETERTFTKHSIDLSQSKQTTFYLVTDGYQDQFGGEKGKKFMTKRFRELLFSIHKETMPKQKDILDQTITKWIADGNETQTDDITVLGFQV